ncbi:PqqD family protein [Halococcus saccharolyticus]|uniref:PqqD family protein n=1 Tax=Halococcus saccharolyticus DSM 5350 TaxID=1227455 RepID=M0MPZ6_9EURY|nr:PqqD family protein [Halococcus saccharolyticus]EMA46515.1 hypothetical protein C449_04180 [Halococcus saccharolyticus DSM 5350]
MSERPSTATPIRTTEDWDCERVDGSRKVTIQRPRQPRNRLDEFLFDLFDTPTERELELDAVGSVVWCHCDGDTTMAELADELAATVPEERIEPVGDTLSYFLAQLAELNLIRYADDNQ